MLISLKASFAFVVVCRRCFFLYIYFSLKLFSSTLRSSVDGKNLLKEKGKLDERKCADGWKINYGSRAKARPLLALVFERILCCWQKMADLLKYDNPLGRSFSYSCWCPHLLDQDTRLRMKWRAENLNDAQDGRKSFLMKFSIFLYWDHSHSPSSSPLLGRLTSRYRTDAATLLQTRIENICKSESHWMSWENGNFTATHWEQQSKSVIIFTLHLCMHTWDGSTYNRKRESSTLKQNSSSASIDEP